MAKQQAIWLPTKKKHNECYHSSNRRLERCQRQAQRDICNILRLRESIRSCTHDLLLKKLKNILPEWLISWLAAYLSDRYQRVKTGKTITEWLLVIQGVIQGSVIGPILFILYIYDINKYIPDEAQLKKYADDILAYLLDDYDRSLPQRIRWSEQMVLR